MDQSTTVTAHVGDTEAAKDGKEDHIQGREGEDIDRFIVCQLLH